MKSELQSLRTTLTTLQMNLLTIQPAGAVFLQLCQAQEQE